MTTTRDDGDREVALGQPHTVSAERSWNALVQIVADELVDGMRWQDRQFPGFSAQTTTDPKLYAVHGVMDVHALAARVINELISLT